MSDWDRMVGREDVSLIGWDTGARAELPIPTRYPGGDRLEFDGVLALSVGGVRIDFGICTDPDDGYRSTLGPVQVVRTESALFQFENEPLPVRVEEWQGHRSEWSGYACEGWRVTGEDGHLWFEFGTEGVSEYYPTSYAEWHVKEEQ